jgi:hypothetical protein
MSHTVSCAGTGGIVDREDWRDIDWQPISALSGGTLQFPTGLGLTPWFAKAFKPPRVPGACMVHASYDANVLLPLLPAA